MAHSRARNSKRLSSVVVGVIACGAALVLSAAGPGAALAGTGAVASAAPSITTGAWGAVHSLPERGAAGVHGLPSALSCTGPGDCEIVGLDTDYAGEHQNGRAFAAVQTNGTWAKAVPVPQLNDLSIPVPDLITSISCPSTGNCSAGGFYGIQGPQSGASDAFVVNERNGKWAAAEVVPGINKLNVGDNAQVTWVSCASAGNCAAGGYYWATSPYSSPVVYQEAFVVNEVNWIWLKAFQVPGTASLNSGKNAGLTDVSCGAPGNCAAVGYFTAANSEQAFIVNEIGGSWQSAKPVAPGVPIAEVVCTAAYYCTAVGGDYEMMQTRGTWSAPAKVSGAPININALSCFAPGDCTAGGVYQPSGGGPQQAFTVEARIGVWYPPRLIPGAVGRTRTGTAGVSAISCPSAGACAAVGWYSDAADVRRGFVVSENGGTWAAVHLVAAGQVNAVSCYSATSCSALVNPAVQYSYDYTQWLDTAVIDHKA
jgi:hypothetical protein